MEPIKNAPTKQQLELEQRRMKIKNQLVWGHKYHEDKMNTMTKALELVGSADEAMLSILENVK